MTSAPYPPDTVQYPNTFLDMQDVCSDVWQVKSFWVHTHTSLLVFKQNLTSQWGVPVRSQRLWLWARCRNGTLRLSEPLDSGYDERQICDIVSLPLCAPSQNHL